ncbi:non-ribosomal peptide synthase/polyketide synthase [Pseudoalteromonas sp. MMG005]|uniref:non-ribosomal peptide synthase/polyketide synthase n=1 Tax=Pseudoalteromonas sp. MMG005 TaxID=2822682 RepID=UPI001B39E989|nr:non-ribosomal peptide synthase/polyketide synthase [Pseudoalteromonas sp. MMG005]MBQ4844782.1 non-ribosomal peptide synthase/polyketide synthase [Pseudoalteromonas sp. MMG005]
MSRQRRTRKNRQLSSLSEADKNKLQQMISGANSGVGTHISEHIADGELVPLTPAQKILWYAWKLDPENTTYNLGGALHFEGLLDTHRVNSAFEQLCQRHDALRIKFVEGDLQDVWQIDGGDQTFTFFETTAVDLAQRDAQLRQIVVQPFDLVEGPLLRVGVVNQGNDSSLVVTLHHIIADGTSMQQLLDEFVAIYVALSEGKASRETVEKVGYLGFAKWLNKQDQQDLYAKQLEVWQKLLQADEPLRLPANNQARHSGQYSVKTQIQVLDEPVWHKVSMLAKANNVTPYLVLLTAWQVLLSRFANATRIQVGVPVANRHLSETFNLVGFFVNTQAYPLTIEHHESFSSLLEQASHVSKIGQGNQDLPFEHLLKALKPERQTGVHPIFQVMFNYLRRNKKSLQQLGGVALLDFEFYRFGMPFDLQLDVIEEVGQETTLNLMYANELYAPEFATQCLNTFHMVLTEVLEHINVPMAHLPLLAEQDLQRLAVWNVGSSPHSFITPVQQIIHDQSQKTPTRIAVSFKDETVTYEQLDIRANRLAHCLLAKGVRAEDKVGVVFERSVGMVVSLLAVLKAGAAYVPIDPTLPLERIDYIAQSSALALFLTDDSHKSLSQLAEIAPMVPVDTLELDQYESSVPNLITHATQLAYVIYTSGSTGNPKGVGNTHEAIYNRIAWQQSAYPLSVDDVVLQKTPFGFDVSVWEFFWPLMYGAKLVVAQPEAHKDSSRLLEVITKERVTTVHFVPSMLQAFINHEGVSSASSIKRILCSGEALPSEVQAKALQLLPNTEIYNLYGPTEAAVDVSHFTCHGDANVSVPIGSPIDGIKLLVLDSGLRLSPIGVAGELYIGGIGLARGYLHRADLTAERFIANPFSNDGERLYRTGDLVHWNVQGQLEYLGRTDHQVKIRGFRIELGEIEACLHAIDEVNEAVVIADKGPSGQRLVAYVSAAESIELDSEQIQNQLAEALPDYMVPSLLMVLPALPLNSNGKIDRNALPQASLTSSQIYQAPQSDNEAMLANIWQETLGVDKVGRLDNFFELGGDSIISLQIVAKVRQVGYVVTPKQMFEQQDIARLALQLEALDVSSIPEQTVTGTAKLLPIQAEFFAKPMIEYNHWNQAIMLRSEQHFNELALQNAVSAILLYHDALRLRYTRSECDQWQQNYSAFDELLLESSYWSRSVQEKDVTALAEEAQRSLDIESGPIARFVNMQLDDGSARLLIVIHHLAVDGVSWRTLINDFMTAYEAAQRNEEIALGLKSHSYQYWAEQISQYPQLFEGEFSYWQSHSVKPLQLPNLNAQGSQAMSESGVISVVLEQATTQALLQNSSHAYRTQINELLLSALSEAVYGWTEDTHICVNLEGHGRETWEDTSDLSRSVGWYTSLFPVSLTRAKALSGTIKNTKEQLRSVPNKGIGYGAFKYYGSPQEQAELQQQPMGQIEFNYLGQTDNTFEKTEQGLSLTLADESVGASFSPKYPQQTELVINGKVFAGQLQFDISFSTARLLHHDVQVFADKLYQSLCAVVEHCQQARPTLTPSDAPLAKMSQAELDELPIELSQLQTLYPLSPMQEGMLFHSLYDEGEAYINQTCLEIENLDVERFKHAWQQVVSRHDALRTGFLTERQQTLQYVMRSLIPQWHELDWQSYDEHELPQLLTQQAQSDSKAGFDLTNDPGLTRLTLVKLAAQKYHFIWTTHHLLTDGWSSSAMMGEVLQAYEGKTLPVAQGQYEQYIAYLMKQDQVSNLAFWAKETGRLSEPSYLTSVIGDEHTDGEYNAYAIEFDEPQTQKLIEFSQQNRVTLNTLIQGSWSFLLSRYLNRASVCFGATTSGRPTDLFASESSQGMFINTVPVVATVDPAMTVSAWLQALQNDNLQAREHEFTPLYDIQKQAGQYLELNKEGLFDTLMVFENYPISKAVQTRDEQDTQFSVLAAREETTYPLTLGVLVDSSLSITFTYQGWKISAAGVETIAKQLKGLLLAFIANNTQLLSALSLVTPAQAESLRTQGFGDEFVPYISGTETPIYIPNGAAPTLRAEQYQDVVSTLNQLAEQTPDAEAVACDGLSYTFKELYEKSSQLAYYLREQGVVAEQKVGVALERSRDLPVAFLAILKAGAVYVPMDLSYPEQRLAYMIKDSQMQHILVSDNRIAELAGEAQLHCLPEITLNDSWQMETVYPAQGAYVIYTSGSTGNPKGVLVSRGSIGMHCRSIGRRYGLSASDRELIFMSFCFDGAHERWLSAVTHGGTVVIRPEKQWDLQETYENMHAQRVSVVVFPPVFLRELAAYVEQIGNPPPVRVYCFGGDAMPQASFELAQRVLKPAFFINGYGPTETVVTPLTWKALPGSSFDSVYAPIGEVLGQRQAWILDDQLNLVLPGMIGELYMAEEVGLARGYLNRPDLTAERFVADPFKEDGSRLYRTGDLVRWNADNQMEYLGRTDHQVKIRGFRIELGEIESLLRKSAGVNEAVVIADDTPSGKRLVGYVSGHDEGLLDVAALKATLAQQLPDYMVPSVLMALAELPTNSNGKIDRKALPKAQLESEKAYVAPEGELETLLAEIWREVLGVEQVGRFDNFFALGGDSINSLRLIALAKSHDITLSVQDIFTSTDLYSLALQSLSSGENTISPLLRAERAQQTLSYAQERQWFLWKLAPESDAYHITGGLILEGTLDFTALQTAFDYVLEKHDALRTRFVEHQDASVTQVVEQGVKANIQRLDGSTKNVESDTFKSDLVKKPFDLTTDKLLRVGLITHAQDKHELIVVMHHIVSDGWSLNLIIADFVAGYSAALKGDSLAVELQPRYSDYAQWQKQWLEEGEDARQLAYWKTNLGDSHPVLELPADLQSDQQEYSNGIAIHAIPKALKAQLSHYAKDQGSTLFALLMSAWHVLLHRYSGQSDIRVGMPIANRQHIESQSIVGFFVNTQVIRSVLSADMALGQVVNVITESLQGAQANQDLPFEKLVDGLELERNLNRSPLFQVMLNYQRQEDNLLSQLPELTISEAKLPTNSAQFELLLEAIEDTEGEVTLYLNYAIELYSDNRVQELLDGFMSILTDIALRPEQTVSSVELLLEHTVGHLIAFGRGNECNKPKMLLHESIEYHSVNTPNQIALRDEEESITYGQLALKVSRLCAYLQANDVLVEDQVGVIFNRNIDMVVSLLAIHQAGAAYVPIDPNLPSDRVKYIVSSSTLKLILTDGSAANFTELAQLSEIHELQDIVYSSDEPHHYPHMSKDNLAYVIYTSGSTGQPKGVAVTHQGLSNYLSYAQAAYLPNVSSSLVSSTLSFDATVTSLLVPLYSGKTVTLLASGDEELSNLIAHLQQSNDATLYKITPAHIDAMLASDLLTTNEQAHCFVVGGDKLLSSTVAQLKALFPYAQIINEYGPTETVVGCSVFNIGNETNERWDVIPITDAIENTQLYVLSDALTLMPIGVPGELYIAGEGLARGYLNQGALTSERFIANPFSDDGARLYRTGDLVRWSFDGELEYLGRTDHQVKVRGFRIELGEIEANLCNIPTVNEAIVVADETENGTQLVAYIVADDDIEYDALKEILRNNLPSYMIPDIFVTLASFPLTHNGKVNRSALPKVDRAAELDFVAPEGELEIMLAAIWRSILGVEQVGRHDNFFELGGDSIVSLQIIAKLRQAGYLVTPKQVFEQQSIARLVNCLIVMEDEDLIEQSVFGEVELLPIQSSFFKNEMVDRSHWNQAVMLHSDQALDDVALNAAISQLVESHDALRMRYYQDEMGGWSQEYTEYREDFVEQNMWLHDVDVADIEQLAQQAQESLDITHGSMMRVVQMRVNDGTYRLLFVIHHLVVDGVSWRVLLDDLAVAYEQAIEGKSLTLALKSHSYQYWADRVREYPSQFKDEFAYWSEQVTQPLQLPNLNAQGSALALHRAAVSVNLDKVRTESLLHDAPKVYRTQINDLLLSALSEALYQWLGQSEVSINLEGHGREPWEQGVDLSRTVGWFTTLYPIVLQRMPSLAHTIIANKENLRAIPNKGIGYSAFKFNGTDEEQAQLQQSSLSQIEFNYLGQFDNGTVHDSTSVWRLASESSGKATSDNIAMNSELAINGQVLNGALSFEISFSQARLNNEDVAQFAAHFEAALQQVVAHCQTTQGTLTPSDVPLTKLSQTQLDALPLNLSNVDDLYPLSPMQEGMLFHSMFEQSSAYINQTCFEVKGLDVARFKQAWQSVIARHDVLRTGFVCTDNFNLQFVAKETDQSWQELDWQNSKLDKAAVITQAQADRERGFDFINDPGLTRLTLIHTGATEHYLIWTSHHLLTDGWSTSVMMGEILQAYEGMSLPKDTVQYKDYITYLKEQDASTNLAYWQHETNRLTGPSYLTSVLNGDSEFRQYGKQYIHFDETQTVSLTAFAKQNHVTINTVIQGAWALLLSRYLNRDTVCFGATTSGRPTDMAGSSACLGMFINTIPVIAEIDPAQSLSTWLQSIQTASVRSREFEFTPLYDIQKQAGERLDLNIEGLFDTLMVFENYPISETLQNGEGKDTAFDVVNSAEETNYPVSLGVEIEALLKITLTYQHDKVSTVSANMLSKQLESLILAMVSNQNQLLSALSLVTPAQAESLRTQGFGDEFVPYISGTETPIYIPNGAAPTLRAEQYQDVVSTLNQLAEQTPDAEAVACDGLSYTFKELYEKSSQLAYYLREQGVVAEQKVGVALERSRDLPVAFLAILKAGAVYVPMDLSYPEQRLAYMIKDSQMQHILVSDNRIAELAGEAQLHCLPEITLNDSWQMETVYPAQGAYVIYTSGSTGNPKGVLVSRGSIGMHCRSIGRRYGLSASDRELIFMSFCFDGAHERWLSAVTHGGTVVIRPEKQWDLQETYENMHAQRVSVVVFPPVFLRELAAYVEQIGNPPPVRVYCFGGDAMPQASFELAQRVLKPAFFINGYGPTETVVTPLTWKALPGSSFDSVYAPIGEVLGQRQAWILDDQLNLVLPGMIGELYMAEEVGLARGYLNRPDLTAERFVADPFKEDGSRLYRTGDLVRWNADNQMEYLGRTDHQVKIRGFRIELGEIESLLRKSAGVNEAVVIADDTPSGKRLVGYVSGHDEGLLDVVALKATLAQQLPDYMVPSVLMALAELPTNSNGKIDRKALPKAQLESEKAYVAPEGELETLLAEIWREVLGVEQVGRFDNFFALGGDSINGLKVTSQWQQRHHLPFNIRLLWQAPDLSSLVNALLSDAIPSVHSLNSLIATGPNLFCLHEGSGLTIAYRPLAQRLDGRVNCIGIAPDDAFDMQSDLQQLANHYASEILRYQQSGPYYLAGWSMGAPIALLVANTLSDLGHTVSMVQLIDSWNPFEYQNSEILMWHQWISKWVMQHVIAREDEVEAVVETYIATNTEAVMPLVDLLMQYKESFSEEVTNLPATELVTLIQVAYHLYTTSRRPINYKVVNSAGIHCWWSSDTSTESTANYYCGLGQSLPETRLEYDHQGIVMSSEVLDGIEQAMEKFL